MNAETDYLGELTKIFTILGVIVLAFSTVRLGVFYFFYNVNFFTYIDVMEIIPQSINSFMFTCFVGLCLFVTVKFLAVLILNQSRIEEMYSQPTFLKSINLYPFVFYLIILLSSLSMISIPIVLFGLVEFYTIIKLFVYILITVLLTSVLIEISRIYYNKHQTFISKRVIYLMLFSAYCVVIGAVEGYDKMYVLKKNDTYLNNSITLDNKVIHSTPTFYYIGKTNKYVFFYNEETKVTEAFAMDTIKKLTLSE